MWDESWFINIKKYNYRRTPQRGSRKIQTSIDAFLLVSGYSARISAISRLQFLDNDNHIFNKSSMIVMNIGYLSYFRRVHPFEENELVSKIRL